MAITKPLKVKSNPARTEEQFIEAAPDGGRPSGGQEAPGIKRGKKNQISVALSPSLLMQLDAAAKRMGQSRNGLISLAVYQLLKTMD
jgi:hypothetical protein